jgi:hypothetical protein
MTPEIVLATRQWSRCSGVAIGSKLHAELCRTRGAHSFSCAITYLSRVRQKDTCKQRLFLLTIARLAG